MAIKPVVRYMVLCDDWYLDPGNRRRVSIEGLISNIHSLGDPSYPLLYRELCVVLVLTEGYGKGLGKVVGVFEETGQKIFETTPRPISFGADPLEIVGVVFRVQDIIFPRVGLYAVQFWYEDELVEEKPLRLR